MNVAICVPTREDVCTGFAYDLAILSARWYAGAPAGSKFDLHFINGTLIADQRQKLAWLALRGEADYVLFLDSDMRFPPDLLERLIAHDKDIVACNYATRRLPVRTVAFSDFSTAECIYSDDREGLEEVDAIGMGAMLVKTEVFKKLPRPWFNISWLPSGGIWVGEDIYFCKLAQAHGFKVWVDHDLSKAVRHIGLMEFTHDHAKACRADLKTDLEAAAEKIEEAQA